MKRKERENVAVRKAVFFIIMIAALYAFTSCGFGEETEITDEEGQMLKLHLDEINDTGFFSMEKSTHLFSPVMSGADGFQGESLVSGSDTEGRFVWCGDKDNDLVSLIPEVDNRDRYLIIFQKEEDEMPEEYTLEKYRFRGYSIGASVTYGETGSSLFLNNEDLCSSSMAKDILGDCSDGLLRIHRINGSKDLPFGNVDTDIEKLLGLEKDKKYQIGFFDGTTYYDEEFIADTAVFKSEQVIPLENPLEPTEYGFFYVKLPVNLENGYYYINDAGLFRYTGNND